MSHKLTWKHEKILEYLTSRQSNAGDTQLLELLRKYGSVHFYHSVVFMSKLTRFMMK